jgi:SAM-dependent methyltransferase
MTVTTNEAVIWHDVECGAYDADLPLWRELAAAAPGPILELGCGTGRVALHLVRCGHSVTAVDSDPALAAELTRRARDLEVTVLVRDMRALEPDERFGLIVAPMQVLQLLDGPESRRAVLRSCAGCLSPGGTVAISIVEGVPEGGGEPAQPLPDVAEIDGWVYSSLPLEIAADGAAMRVTRLRQVVSPAGELTERVDETHLAVLHAATLEAEAREAGLRPAGRREVPSTLDHVGSVVVMLEGE